MATESVSRTISEQLRRLMAEQSLTLEYVHHVTGLSMETVRLAKLGRTRLHDRTAHKLAEFIEQETNDGLTARRLLHAPAQGIRMDLQGASLRGEDLSGRMLAGADLRGADLSGATLTGAILWKANLSEANMKDVRGRGVDLNGAKMTGANLSDIRFDCWDMGGEGDWTGAVIRNCRMWMGRVTSADWRRAELRNVIWQAGSWASHGFRAAFDPGEIRRGWCNPEMISTMLEHVAGDDREIMHITARIRVGSLPRAWVPAIEAIKKGYPGAFGRMMSVFEMYPSWHLPERIDLAYAIRDCRTYEDALALKKRPDYDLFKNDIGWVLDGYRRRLQD